MQTICLRGVTTSPERLVPGKSREQIRVPQVASAQALAANLRHVTRGYYFGHRILDASASGSWRYGNRSSAPTPKKRSRAVIYENRDTWVNGTTPAATSASRSLEGC